MKTTLKLSKNGLFSLYEKSSEQVKESLRAEFGQYFFAKGESRPKADTIIAMNQKSHKDQQFRIDWAMVSDFTSALRMFAYGLIIWIVL